MTTLASLAAASTVRPVTRAIRSLPVMDGEGVAIRRALGHDGLQMLDPFLLLDDFRADDVPAGAKVPGFPDHPHRGFETVTYMLAGRMHHRDSIGTTGVISAGGVQWMTAGRGIIHSEMPEPVDGRLRGFQLWINLPAAEKLRKPRYQEFAASRVPVVQFDGGATGRLIAGRLASATGAAQDIPTNPLYLDLDLPVGGSAAVPVPTGHSAFVYVYAGAVTVEGAEGPARMRVSEGVVGVLGVSGAVQLRTAEGAGVLLLAARPLNEPVARYGPFVMNRQSEVQQAFADYRSGAFL